MSTPDFADAAAVAALPSILAIPIQVMMSEIDVSGEITTADETALVVEALVAWTGTLWLAEYLRAIALDASRVDELLNRDLFERLGSPKPVLTGQWVSLGRRARAALKGWPTVVEGLAAIDYGQPGDGRALDQLLAFRNHFSHGSFASSLQDIRRHRRLLATLIASVPALATQPVLWRGVEGDPIREARGDWSAASDSGANVPVSRPVIVSSNGAILELYPFVFVDPSGPVPQLRHAAGSVGKALAALPVLTTWLARYERERSGHLPYTGPTDATTLSSGLQDGLRAALSSPTPGLILIEAHPGSGEGAAIAALTQDDPAGLSLDRFGALGRVSVVPGDLGQSGVTVAAMVLRLTEQALGEADGTRAMDRSKLLSADGPIQQAAADLSKAGTQVLLGIHNLHLGATDYRREGTTVVELYRALAGTPITVVATTRPGALARPLYDHRLTVAAPDAPDPTPVAAEVARLAPAGSLHHRVLTCLAGASEAQDLFAVCDSLEATGGDTVFEPAVERALWDLQPLLCWTRAPKEQDDGSTERVRLWRVFHPVVAAALS